MIKKKVMLHMQHPRFGQPDLHLFLLIHFSFLLSAFLALVRHNTTTLPGHHRLTQPAPQNDQMATRWGPNRSFESCSLTRKQMWYWSIDYMCWKCGLLDVFWSPVDPQKSCFQVFKMFWDSRPFPFLQQPFRLFSQKLSKAPFWNTQEKSSKWRLQL